jgi:hypothetical protein
MLLRCFCPRCGKVREYIAEEVGQSRHCNHCGGEFTLKPNNGRVAWHIIGATAFVLFVIGGLAARYYWKANKYNRDPSRTSTVSFTLFDDE